MFGRRKFKCIQFCVDFDNIIDLCNGFEAYFNEHPEEQVNFPCCNAQEPYSQNAVTSTDMFVGRKTQLFESLLNILSIDVDAKFLEKEYYFTRPNTGNVYWYRSHDNSIFFDFFIEPTAQVEVCTITLICREELYETVHNSVKQLVEGSKYATGKIMTENAAKFMSKNRKRLIDMRKYSK